MKVDKQSVEEFETGAVRSNQYAGSKPGEMEPRFDLIPVEPLTRLARRYSLGASKYGENNWKKGMPTSVIYNHIVAHLTNWNEHRDTKSRINDDDDLAAVAWGVMALMYFEKNSNGSEKDYLIYINQND